MAHELRSTRSHAAEDEASSHHEVSSICPSSSACSSFSTCSSSSSISMVQPQVDVVSQPFRTLIAIPTSPVACQQSRSSSSSSCSISMSCRAHPRRSNIQGVTPNANNLSTARLPTSLAEERTIFMANMEVEALL